MGRFPQAGKRLPIISFRRLRERARELLAAVDLKVPPQALVSALSPGERQLVEIAKALSLDAKIIIFDDPPLRSPRDKASVCSSSNFIFRGSAFYCEKY
jgi:ribose transport system ATP-binding protein